MEIKTSWFKFWVPSRHLRSLVIIPTMEKIRFTSIWLPTIPKIWWTKYLTIGSCASWTFHHFSGSSQDFASNCKFWKQENSHFTYNQIHKKLVHYSFIIMCIINRCQKIKTWNCECKTKFQKGFFCHWIQDLG